MVCVCYVANTLVQIVCAVSRNTLVQIVCAVSRTL
jgi:hypothetical protein